MIGFSHPGAQVWHAGRCRSDTVTWIRFGSSERAQTPRNTGRRFSMNARRVFAVEAGLDQPVADFHVALLARSSSPTVCFTACRVSGAFSAIVAQYWRVKLSRVPVATIRFTKPISRASAAEKWRAVKKISLAWVRGPWAHERGQAPTIH
jgi:hypothetical protein